MIQLNKESIDTSITMILEIHNLICIINNNSIEFYDISNIKNLTKKSTS
jgi:hypothetical protein